MLCFQTVFFVAFLNLSTGRKSATSHSSALISTNLELTFCQSNSESEIIELIQSVQNKHDGLIINPAGYTHTSVAILDALRAISKPKIEIHLSNIYLRENYRKTSITAAGVNGSICGFGYLGYILAIEALNNILNNNKKL
mgnify:CR=1 FL=1